MLALHCAETLVVRSKQLTAVHNEPNTIMNMMTTTMSARTSMFRGSSQRVRRAFAAASGARFHSNEASIPSDTL